MLEELKGRLRDLEIMAGARRPSMWHQKSTGSVGSNNESSHFGSPHNSVQGQLMYPSPPALASPSAPPPSSGNYRDGTASLSPPQYFPPQPPQLYQQSSASHAGTYAVQPPHTQPGAQQSYNFNEPASSFPNPAFDTAPHQQFGVWQGYDGASAPDTLDQENAVPPNSFNRLPR
jgi:hypothetical protein